MTFQAAVPSVDVTVVIPTVGRPNLTTLLRALDNDAAWRPAEIIVVDDRPDRPASLSLPTLQTPIRVLRSGGRGPAAARNVGWRSALSDWIAFLDDDVVPPPDWGRRLTEDLSALAPADAGSQAKLVVPLPENRRPTDVERGTIALATARWITADMAYRRAVLDAVGGFDERFPRAYREDADIALRISEMGYRISDGDRVTTHPPAHGTLLTSVQAQRGNRDNALMRSKHGPCWRDRIGEGSGRMRQHIATTLAGGVALALAATGHRRAATSAGAGWAASTAEFAWRRIAPGPKTATEIGTMLLTSALVPPMAVGQRLLGEWQVRRGWRAKPARRPRAILFDRDDTLIVDVPYLTDPALVQPVSGAKEVLDRLRAEGVLVGVVSNQSGVARGLISPEQLDVVTRRVDELLGPFASWQVCVHGPEDDCACRKPRPGMVHAAAADMGVAPADCVLIGDIGADVAAAQAAGAQAVLVPTKRTLGEEIERARRTALVAPDLVSAVELALAGAEPAERPDSTRAEPAERPDSAGAR